MATCTLYYPGLLGPDVSLEELPAPEWPASKDFPNLCKLLDKADIRPVDLHDNQCSVEARILRCLGISFPETNDVPVAQLRASQLLPENENIWCLDPVHIQIELDEAILLANESLKLSEHEAKKIIADLNKHFVQDDIFIEYHSPHQWLLKGHFELATQTLSEVMLNDINKHRPEGSDQTRWQQLLSEIQMLLYAHPVNAEREQQGEFPVNSLWLWGGGQYKTIESHIDLVYADDTLVADVVTVTDTEHRALPIKLHDKDLVNRQSLIILTDQLHAIKTKDVFYWFDCLQRFENNILAPLLGMLANGSIDSLIVHSDTIELTLDSRVLCRVSWKFWRGVRPLHISINQLRRQYGH